MQIYLIRHGETDYNKSRRIQGQCDIELNNCGRELAKITAQALKDVPFDLVFTSPLKRAKETAEIIVGDRQIPVIEDVRIREISFGEYEGLCCDPRNYNIPDKDFLNFFNDTVHYHVPPKGESLKQVIDRTENFFKELVGKEEFADKTILVSTHGCALKAMLASINHTPIAQFWGEGVHKNYAVTRIEVKAGIIEILEEGKVYYS